MHREQHGGFFQDLQAKWHPVPSGDHFQGCRNLKRKIKAKLLPAEHACVAECTLSDKA
jgi:hypothetical protein